MNTPDINQQDFDQQMEWNGWYVFDRALPGNLVSDMRRDCLKWVEICKEYQIKNRINEAGDGTAHHAVGTGDSIDAFLDLHLFHPYLSHFFADAPYIMHACNPVGGFPRLDTYIHKVHRDVATFIPNFHMRVNMLVMLDDSTLR